MKKTSSLRSDVRIEKALQLISWILLPIWFFHSHVALDSRYPWKKYWGEPWPALWWRVFLLKCLWLAYFSTSHVGSIVQYTTITLLLLQYCNVVYSSWHTWLGCIYSCADLLFSFIKLSVKVYVWCMCRTLLSSEWYCRLMGWLIQLFHIFGQRPLIQVLISSILVTTYSPNMCRVTRCAVATE